ncbi:MAG: hypothetical protein IPP93_10245 [Chitinophagaceae bacterium]|nr:hypothetical protein [Chitinophagaceae bacterium]
MQIKQTVNNMRYPVLLAVIVNIMLFALFYLFATPLLNSGDDAYFMYTLSGGYGEAPTSLLHYDYGWHYWLGSVVKQCFILEPGFNWYSFILNLFHFSGCASILFVLRRRMPLFKALLFFVIFFLLIETRMLLSLSYTGAAWVMGAGGALLMIEGFRGSTVQGSMVKWLLGPGGFLMKGMILIILAGMLRYQMMEMVILLSLPLGYMLLSRKAFFKLAALMLVAVVVVVGLFKIHEAHYRKHIAGWDQQEKFRQALFIAYNKSIKPAKQQTVFYDSLERNLFNAGFLYDSTRFTPERVATITKQITRNRYFDLKEDRIKLYWVLRSFEFYFLLIVMVLALWIWQGYKTQAKRWLYYFLFVLAVYLLLYVFLKITHPVYMGLMMMLWLQLALQSPEEEQTIKYKRLPLIYLPIMIVALFGAKAAWQENSNNIIRKKYFYCAMENLNRYPDRLYVATDDNFPLGWIGLWDDPKEYPVYNLIYKDRLITHTYLTTIQRFGIRDFQQALLHDKRIYLLGDTIPGSDKIFPGTILSGPIKEMVCLLARQLKQQDTVTVSSTH